jgi:hypothetical protein
MVFVPENGAGMGLTEILSILRSSTGLPKLRLVSTLLTFLGRRSIKQQHFPPTKSVPYLAHRMR